MSTFAVIRDKFAEGMGNISTQRHIVALKNGMLGYVPFTMIGSIAILITNFPSQGYLNFMAGIFGENWQAPINELMNGTMNLGALFVVALVANEMSQYHKLHPIMPTLTSMGVFIYMMQLTEVDGAMAIKLSEFGAANFVVSIILGLIIPEMYHFVLKRNWTIKLPEQVPPMVQESFKSIIPMTLIFISFFIVKQLVAFTPYDYLAPMINTVIGIPLKNLTTSIWGYLIAVLIMSLLWGMGIHGTAIVMNVLSPFLLMNSDQNRLAMEAGQELPNILTNEYLSLVGGVSFYIGIAVLLVAKRKELREVSKIGMVPGTFGIHEPLVFGLPIMFNPYLVVPYVILHVLGAGLTYIVMKLGLVARLTGTGVPWTMPPVLYGFLASGGHISTAIWQVILAVIFVVVCIPFVKMYEKDLAKQDIDNNQPLPMKDTVTPIK